MAEYIEIDAPIDVAVYQRNRRIKVTLRQILESNDAKYERADVRPVVLCGECKFWGRERISCEGLARCNTGESGVRYRNRNDFCSRGEKREER